ncbi:MAG: SPOR domain-containing protein [Oceanicoccus sp.]
MRWILIVLLMCNGIYFLWQNYLLPDADLAAAPDSARYGGSNGGAKLTLLSEYGAPPVGSPLHESGAGLQANEIPALSPTAVPAVLEPSAVCWQIGPFKEEISARQIMSRLSAMDISLQLQSVDIPAESDYWVYLPPEVSRKAAIKLLRELQSKKIDSFLITEGERTNGISLGFFTQKDRADSVMKMRSDQGYSPAIREIVRVDTEFWLIFDEAGSGKLSDVLWEKIIQGSEGLERRKNYCDKIASADNFD